MFDKMLQQLVGGGGSRKKKDTPRRVEPREPSALSGFAPIDSPAAEPGPGFSSSAAPLGFSSPFTPPTVGPRVVGFAERAPRGSAAAFDVPLDQAVADRAAPAKKAKKTESRLPERQPVVAAARSAVLRDRSENVDELKKAVEAPDLQATMGQRVAAEEAGRAAKRGDRQALRQALAGLVQKLNVASPKDAAVLLKQEAGLQAGNQVRGLLGQGKMTLDGTPGGRLFGKVGPIIRDYAPVDMKGEVDGAYGGLAEKFALTAQGKVDVILGAAPAGAGGAAAVAGGAPSGIATGPLSAGAPPIAETGGGSSAGGGGGLSIGEVGSEAPVAGSYGSAPSPSGHAVQIGEVDPADTARVRPGEGVSARAMANMGVAEAEPDGKVRIGATTPGIGTTVNANPMPSVAASADQSQRVMPEAGIAPPGSLQVGAVEMPADTPQPVVRDAGRSVVAGKMTLQQVLQQNPGISEVNLQQVAPTPKGGGMLKSLGSMASGALLQRFGGGGGGGTMD